jgi:acetolactate synthase I/III small subunit
MPDLNSIAASPADATARTPSTATPAARSTPTAAPSPARAPASSATTSPIAPTAPVSPESPLAATPFHAAAPSAQRHLIHDTVPGTAETKRHAIEDTAFTPAVVLELRVRNHPGAMSHITGLFARRAFNLEGIVCIPVDDGATSRMLLLVAGESQLEQIERQLAKLYDVLEVRHRPDLGAAFFAALVPDPSPLPVV